MGFNSGFKGLTLFLSFTSYIKWAVTERRCTRGPKYTNPTL